MEAKALQINSTIKRYMTMILIRNIMNSKYLRKTSNFLKNQWITDFQPIKTPKTTSNSLKPIKHNNMYNNFQ